MAPIQLDSGAQSSATKDELQRLLLGLKARNRGRLPFRMTMLILGAALVGVSGAECVHKIAESEPIWGAFSLLLTGTAILAGAAGVLAADAVRARRIEWTLRRLDHRE